MKVWGSWEISEISAVSMKFIVVTCYITATRRAAADAADVACGSVSTAPESRNEAPIQLRRYRTSCRGKNGHSKYRQHGEVPQNAQCNHSFSPFIITECRKEARYSFRHDKPKPSPLQAPALVRARRSMHSEPSRSCQPKVRSEFPTLLAVC